MIFFKHVASIVIIKLYETSSVTKGLKCYQFWQDTNVFYYFNHAHNEKHARHTSVKFLQDRQAKSSYLFRPGKINVLFQVLARVQIWKWFHLKTKNKSLVIFWVFVIFSRTRVQFWKFLDLKQNIYFTRPYAKFISASFVHFYLPHSFSKGGR